VKKSPIIEPLLEYRQMEKLRSTYADALQEEINPFTGRIHCNFNQVTTATGRLSCQNPNLQNIPVRSEEGKKIRTAFRPEVEGWNYLSADYSQIELRLLAHLSEDPILIEAFNSGEDVHLHTASVIFNTPLAEVTPEMRYRAKAVNFGVLYGQQAFGLSQGLKMDYKEASRFIETYFERYKKVKEYIESCKEFVRKNGFSETMTGRKRPIPEIESKNPVLKGLGERLAVNTPLQGTAADLIKLAMIKIHKDWEFKQSFMILQIHDELLFEVPREEEDAVARFVKAGMENVFSLKVPLTVDISIGKNWGEC
jgi:DNA polymerase-1